MVKFPVFFFLFLVSYVSKRLGWDLVALFTGPRLVYSGYMCVYNLGMASEELRLIDFNVYESRQQLGLARCESELVYIICELLHV